MIGRNFRRTEAAKEVEAKGFDAFEMRLGDLMRGERATLGKSLLDVQRELKIKAAYIAAIENCDPTAFDTPGFIAGYVRSYARYLGMDPDEAFGIFCSESGFRPAHGMSSAASVARKRPEDRISDAGIGRDIFASSTTPFIPAGDSMFSGLEPRAVGSVLVLAALIGGLGWGGWSVLQEVQKVQFAPVEQAPEVVADVDPLAGASRPASIQTEVASATILPSAEAFDRLYRPQALDTPVLVSRDGPIASLSARDASRIAMGGGEQVAALHPGEGGLAPSIRIAGDPVVGPDPVAGADLVAGSDPVAGAVQLALAGPGGANLVPQVTEAVPELMIVAVRPAWVRVRSAEGTTLFEKIMDAGETWQIPATEVPATLRVGESGALYFAVNGQHFGPAGPRGSVTSDLALSAPNLTATYQVADLTQDTDLAEFVRYAEVQTATPVAPLAPVE